MTTILVGDLDPDEAALCDAWQDAHPEVTLIRRTGHLGLEDLREVDHIDAVCVLGTQMNDEMIAEAAARGARVIANRSIGYDNVDCVAARAAGLKVTHVVYSPGSVAEFALMLILMAVRKMAQMSRRYALQDFVPAGLDGRELASLCVGIVGAGRIGGRLAQLLSSFGCTVLASDPVRRSELEGLVEYVELDDLYRRADVVTVHALLDDTTHHLIDAAALARMRDGVVVVNCARGAIVDTAALADAVESGKVGAAALDVIEGEIDFYFADCRDRPIAHTALARLRACPNVILTAHLAYLTREVIQEMVWGGLDHALEVIETGSSDAEVGVEA